MAYLPVAPASCGIAAAFLLGSFAAPLAVTAQFVDGRVIHATTEQPLVAVHIELRTTDDIRVASALTDSAGRFRAQASRTGALTLTASLIGYQPVETVIDVTAGERVEVVIRMSEEAITLDPIQVEVRSRVSMGALAGYYDRVERHRRMGFGRIVTRDQIEARNAIGVTDLLRMVPRVRVRSGMGGGDVYFSSGMGGCVPKVYLDGVLANRNSPASVDALVSPWDLEGIEVYQGLAQMPGEFYDVAGCGVILMWTRRMDEDGRPMSLRRILAIMAAIGMYLFIVK
ncbi:hypothetical protein BH23GEM10_BH23GEM10_01280 [soil metagenome]